MSGKNCCRQRSRLGVGVRTLRGIFFRRRWRFNYLNFEVHGQLLGRKTSSFVTSLISQTATNFILAGQHSCQRMHLHRKIKFPAIDTQLLIWSKCKTHLLTRWICDFPDNDVGRHIEFQSGRNQIFRGGFVGIDVKTRTHVKSQCYVGSFSSDHGSNWRRRQRNRWCFPTQRVLCHKGRGAKQEQKNEFCDGIQTYFCVCATEFWPMIFLISSSISPRPFNPNALSTIFPLRSI